MNTKHYIYENDEHYVDFINKNTSKKDHTYYIQVISTHPSAFMEHIYGLTCSLIPNLYFSGIHQSNIISKGLVTNDQTIFSLIDLLDDEMICFYEDFTQPLHKASAKTLHGLTDPMSAIHLVSTMSVDSSQHVIDQIKEQFPNVPIVGGILQEESTPAFFVNGHFFSSGYILLFIKSKENNDFIHYHDTDIIPLGKSHRLSQVDGYRIKKIDNTPALSFYEDFTGIDLRESPQIGYNFPLVYSRNGYLLPSIVKKSTRGSSLITTLSSTSKDQVSLGLSDSNRLIARAYQLKGHFDRFKDMYGFVYASTYTIKTYLKSDCDILDMSPIDGLITDYEFLDCGNGKCYVASHLFVFTQFSKQNLSNPLLGNHVSDHRKFIKDEGQLEQSVLVRLVTKSSDELNNLNRTLEQMVVQKTNELSTHYYIDTLTQLPNLNRLVENIHDESIYALCLIDISSFININNFYGTNIGNCVLKELANLIVAFDDMNNFKTFRVHADLFAVVSFDTSFKLFCNRMKLLQKKIHAHCFVSREHKIFINTTFAISNITLSLYENASMTLEHAKSEKINFLIYKEDLNIEESIICNLTWTLKIRNAINANRILPFFQPIYNNELECIDRFEVLMRLEDDDHNIISPFHFLPIAKKACLYDDLTRIIIRKAFDYFENKNFKFSINLSAADITNNQTRNYIYKALSLFTHPQDVIFEIVESESIENYETVRQFIQNVKAYGAEIAIDDFGTGFSNFHYLYKLNIDCIKIDGSIIQRITKEKSAKVVVETIVDFAQKIGVATVAEYVSDEEIFNKAKELGISFSQGYFIAKPESEIIM